MTEQVLDARTVSGSPRHVVTFPFPLQHSQGGLTSVILREARMREGLTCLTTDEQSWPLAHSLFKAADSWDASGPEEVRKLQSSLMTRWFGTGQWQCLYERGYSDATLPPEVVRQMFLAHDSQHSVGSVDYLIEYIARHSPSSEIERRWSQRFNRLMAQIPDGSIVNWQDFFFEPTINQHADGLRARGCFQTFHLHEAMPANAWKSEWGRDFLRAMAKMDVVYVHTDHFARLLEGQLDRMLPEFPSGSKMPLIKRFDLGADEEWIKEGQAKVTRQTFLDVTPDYDKLNPQQKALVEEVFATQDKIAHRFLVLDRIDATKGTYTVLQAMDAFLDSEVQGSRVDDLDRLRGRYRFFFFQELLNIGNYKPDNLKDQYVRIVKEKFDELTKKWPGIVWVCESIKGPQRILLPAMMMGCHGLSGGSDDGSNLAIPEVLLANRGYPDDTTAILGDGAGFAMQAKAMGFKTGIEIPQAGSPREFAEAMRRVVQAKDSQPGKLAREREAFLVDFVDRRKDSVVVAG